jgi:hypothetical protein
MTIKRKTPSVIYPSINVWRQRKKWKLKKHSGGKRFKICHPGALTILS